MSPPQLALTETYFPLLQTFEKLVEDPVDFRNTFSPSPTLLSILEDRILLNQLAKKEIARRNTWNFMIIL